MLRTRFGVAVSAPNPVAAPAVVTDGNNGDAPAFLRFRWTPSPAD
jgi:hypothetical protein